MGKTKKIYIDFEFNGTKKKDFDLVCAAYRVDEGAPIKHWLHNKPAAWKGLKDELASHIRGGAIIVCFNLAEPRCFTALGLDPRKAKWIDLQTEWKMLTNHNNELAYGWQLIDGKKTFTKPPLPKWAQTEEAKMGRNSSRAQSSLAACTFKLLGVQIDTEHKNAMRDLIISTPEKFTAEQKKAILDYCASDVEYLPKILKAMREHYRKRLTPEDLRALPREMLLRGEYSARSAVMERVGYPVNVEATKNFVASIPAITEDICTDIISQFPKHPPFRWNNSRQAHSMDLGTIRAWMAKQNVRWMKTETGLLSVSHDAFAEHFHHKHTYPKGNFGAQMLRYFKFKQSLNGFLPPPPNSRKRTFFDYLGEDGRCRPYMGIYGAQSARSQPAATGFIPLKAAWMRSLIEPRPGYACGSIDYGSQEFLISGLVSRDKNMIRDYASGDVYLAFAKADGSVPKEATKKTHPVERELYKSTVLGLSYNMGPVALAAKLTQDMAAFTGKEYTEEEAQEFISKFFGRYDSFANWNETNLEEYRMRGYLKLPCGWIMFGDNDNFRSVNNVVIQGTGSSILRRAVALAQDRLKGIGHVIFTLHDALYIEAPTGRIGGAMDILRQAMKEAFVHYFRGDLEKSASYIRLDGDVWGPDFAKVDSQGATIRTPAGWELKFQTIYIDERAEAEYLQFSKYFKAPKIRKSTKQQSTKENTKWHLKKSKRAKNISNTTSAKKAKSSSSAGSGLARPPISSGKKITTSARRMTAK